jgi:hypothetical protein
MNWMGIGFVLGWMIGLPTYMVVMLIVEHNRKKRRDRRCHGRIRNWWELNAE